MDSLDNDFHTYCKREPCYGSISIELTQHLCLMATLYFSVSPRVSCAVFRPKMDGLVELRGGLTAWSGLIDSVLCNKTLLDRVVRVMTPYWPRVFFFSDILFIPSAVFSSSLPFVTGIQTETHKYTPYMYVQTVNTLPLWPLFPVSSQHWTHHCCRHSFSAASFLPSAAHFASLGQVLSH